MLFFQTKGKQTIVSQLLAHRLSLILSTPTRPQKGVLQGSSLSITLLLIYLALSSTAFVFSIHLPLFICQKRKHSSAPALLCKRSITLLVDMLHSKKPLCIQQAELPVWATDRVSVWLWLKMQSGRDRWRIEMATDGEWRVEVMMVEKLRQFGEWEGKAKAVWEKGKRRTNYGRRWTLRGIADVWTLGGQGRWVVPLKWVLTEPFLTWSYPCFFLFQWR